MHNIASGVIDKFGLPGEVKNWGKIKGIRSNVCLDTSGVHFGKFGTSSCDPEVFKINTLELS